MKLETKKNSRKNRKKNRNKASRGASKYWMTFGAMGALLICSPASAIAESPKAAKFAPRVMEAIYGAVRAQQSQRFDIPPGSLETVLAAFQKLAELQVLVPNEKLGAIPSPG